MTSTTLSFNSNFAPVFRKTFKQRLAGLIATLMGGTAFAVIILIFTVNSSFDEYITNASGKNILDLSIPMLAVIVASACICGVFSLAICTDLFSEIYKKQSCDMYYSLPVKRECYFDSNYIYGLLINTIGFITPIIFYGIGAHLVSTDDISFNPEGRSFIAVSITVFLAVIAIYSAFVMCAVTAGKKIHYIFFAFICLLCTSQVISGVVININTIWGMSVKGASALSLDPVYNAANAVIISDKHILPLCIISIVETIGMFSAGRIIFKNRSAEVAEVTVSGKYFPAFLLVLISVAAFMRYSTVFNVVLSIVFGVVAAVFVAVIFALIIYKKPFTKQTVTVVFATCLACIMFIVSLNLPVYSFYVKKLPEASTVESVEISNVSTDDMYISNVLNMFIMSELVDDNQFKIKITDENSINNAIALHKKLIDDDVIYVSKQPVIGTLLQYLIDVDNFDNTNLYNCKITYHLKSGKNFERSYSAKSSWLVKEYAELMRSEDILNQFSPFNITDKSYLASFVDTSYFDEMDEAVFDIEDFVQQADFNKLSDFKSVLMGDIMKLDDKATVSCLYNMISNSLYVDHINDYKQCASVIIYSLTEDAPSDAEEKLRSMTPKQLADGYDSYNYDDMISPFRYVNATRITITDIEVDTLNYLKSLGVDFRDNADNK